MLSMAEISTAETAEDLSSQILHTNKEFYTGTKNCVFGLFILL